MSKVIIIGGGISGLTAGIKLLNAGHQVTLIEKNKDVGGLCSGYFVDGFLVDTCIHWLMGTKKGNFINDLWREIGGLGRKVKIISLPTLGTIEYEGVSVTFYRDLDKAEKEWINISPKDKRAIHRFFSAVKNVGGLMNIMLGDRLRKVSVLQFIKGLPNSRHILKSMKQSREEYAKNFSHPALRYAITHCQTGYNNMFFFFDLYSIFAQGNADVPEGGAYYLRERIKDNFISLGGKLLLGATAKEIEPYNNYESVRVKTSKGVVIGDYCISAIDPYYTLDKLLDGRYPVPQFERRKKAIEKNTISSCFNVYVTIEGDLSKIDVPTGLHISPIKVGSQEVDFMLMRSYHFDKKHFVKDGKTVVSLFIDQNQDDYNYFNSLPKDEYAQESQRIIKNMIDAVEERYPEFKGKINYLSHFSPIELSKRVNTSYGSFQSFSFTDKGTFYINNGKIKDCPNVFLCGQWTRSIGGTPTALLSAHNVCRYIPKSLK